MVHALIWAHGTLHTQTHKGDPEWLLPRQGVAVEQAEEKVDDIADGDAQARTKHPPGADRCQVDSTAQLLGGIARVFLADVPERAQPSTGHTRDDGYWQSEKLEKIKAEQAMYMGRQTHLLHPAKSKDP